MKKLPTHVSLVVALESTTEGPAGTIKAITKGIDRKLALLFASGADIVTTKGAGVTYGKDLDSAYFDSKDVALRHLAYNQR